MSGARTIQEIVSAAAQRDFVGRRRELSAVQEAARSEDRDVLVVFVTGPGGIGKSRLLRRGRPRGAGAWTPPPRLPRDRADADGLPAPSPPPSASPAHPEPGLARVAGARGGGPKDGPAARHVRAVRPPRHLAAPGLPAVLPEHVVTVCRPRPARGRVADGAGLGGVAREVHLEPLDQAESVALLRARVSRSARRPASTLRPRASARPRAGGVGADRGAGTRDRARTAARRDPAVARRAAGRSAAPDPHDARGRLRPRGASPSRCCARCSRGRRSGRSSRPWTAARSSSARPRGSSSTTSCARWSPRPRGSRPRALRPLPAPGLVLLRGARADAGARAPVGRHRRPDLPDREPGPAHGLLPPGRRRARRRAGRGGRRARDPGDRGGARGAGRGGAARPLVGPPAGGLLRRPRTGRERRRGPAPLRDRVDRPRAGRARSRGAGVGRAPRRRCPRAPATAC